jgi:hypothetical protein
MAAGPRRVNRHQLTLLQVEIGPIRGEAAGEFMTWYERLADCRLADGAFQVIVQVTATNADGSDIQQDFICGADRLGQIADPDVTDPMNESCAHLASPLKMDQFIDPIDYFIKSPTSGAIRISTTDEIL